MTTLPCCTEGTWKRECSPACPLAGLSTPCRAYHRRRERDRRWVETARRTAPTQRPPLFHPGHEPGRRRLGVALSTRKLNVFPSVANGEARPPVRGDASQQKAPAPESKLRPTSLRIDRRVSAEVTGLMIRTARRALSPGRFTFSGLLTADAQDRCPSHEPSVAGNLRNSLVSKLWRQACGLWNVP
jgi:hypothetical protein